MIRIEDVFETPEVLYIILELYHSMKHSTSNMSFISLFLVSCIDREYKKSKVLHEWRHWLSTCWTWIMM